MTVGDFKRITEHRKKTAQTSVSMELVSRGGAIPSMRLLPLCDRYERENAARHGDRGTSASLQRRLYKVRHEAEFVSMDFADRLLVDMNMSEEWHVELYDLYHDEAA